MYSGDCQCQPCGDCPLVTGDLADIGNWVYVGLWECELVTGDVESLSSDAQTLGLNGCALLTGDLSDFSSTVTYLDAVGCVLLTGSSIAHMTGIGSVDISNQAADQTRVNAIIDNIYAAKESFTDTTITMNIGGNNAAPSAAQILKIEELQADYGWAITYTLPS